MVWSETWSKLDHGNSFSKRIDHRKADQRFPKWKRWEKQQSQEIVNYHIVCLFGVIFMHRTGQVAWEKQLLSLSWGKTRKSDETSKEMWEHCLNLPVLAITHISWLWSKWWGGDVLTANVMTFFAGAAPLNTYSPPCAGVLPAWSGNSCQTVESQDGLGGKAP